VWEIDGSKVWRLGRMVTLPKKRDDQPRSKQQKALEHSRASYDIAGFCPLASRGEYALQGDDKGQAEKRHHVVVRLTAAGDRRTERAHRHVFPGYGRRIYVSEPFLSAGPDVVRRTGIGGGEVGCGLSGVAMGGYFRLQQCDCLLAADLAQVAQAQARALAGLHGRGALEVGQREVALAVAAVYGTEKGKQRRVLANRQELAIAQGPALGGKVSREDSDFSYEWI
jgi:hypothetical protein